MPKLEEQAQPPGRRARRARSMHVSSSLAEINVVPLVDVMLVLLVVFMVAAPLMTQGFPVHLPESRKSSPVKAPVTVAVPVTFRQDNMVRLGTESIRLDVLGERIRQALDGQLNRDVIVAGDGTVTLQEFFRVADKLREAGVVRVGLQTQPAIQRVP